MSNSSVTFTCNIKMLCERTIFLFALAGHSRKDGKDNPCCQVVENSANKKNQKWLWPRELAARLPNLLRFVIL